MIPENGPPSDFKWAVLQVPDMKHRSMTTAQINEIEARASTPVSGDVLVLVNEVRKLRGALVCAILQRQRASKVCVDYDPAGSTYEVDWLPEVKGWAELCELDLEKHDPFFYCTH